MRAVVTGLRCNPNSQALATCRRGMACDKRRRSLSFIDKGSHNNNFPFWRSIHPACPCCENLKFNPYSCVFAPCQTGASTPQIRKVIVARALNPNGWVVPVQKTDKRRPESVASERVQSGRTLSQHGWAGCKSVAWACDLNAGVGPMPAIFHRLEPFILMDH